MDNDDIITELEDRIDAAVHELCVRHYDAPTQEHQLTSRLAQKLEDEISLIVKGRLAITVTAHDVPDKGRGAAERAIGSDLFIRVIRRDVVPPVSKGFLVQSKWDRTLRKDASLRSQSNNMYRITRKGAFVWVYGPAGIHCVSANKTRHELLPHNLMADAVSPGRLIADGLRCTEGDPEIGFAPDGALDFDDMLVALRARAGLEVTLTPVGPVR